MEKYIGKKVKGFKFEDSDDFGYTKEMDEYIGKIGIIDSFYSVYNQVVIEFEDGQSWDYPAYEVLNHLLDEFIPTNFDGEIENINFESKEFIAATDLYGTPSKVKQSVTIVSKIPSVESLLRGAKPNVNQVPIETTTHYQTNKGFDVIDIAEAYNLNFNRGSAVKYICRAGKKEDEIEDLKKAIEFLSRELKNLEK